MPIAAAAVDICQPTGEKKRKEVDLAANNESGPPKKKYRYKCSVDGCGNWRVRGGVCRKHGAKLKRCSVEECTNKAREGGVCWRHGAKVEYKLCSVDDCTNQAYKGGVCIRHGATKKRCSVGNCTNNALRRGVCWTHGAKVEVKRCSVHDCTKYAQKGGVCMRHGAIAKRCSVAYCTNVAVNEGVCTKHGANGDRCKFEGAKSDCSGFCSRHQEHRPNISYYNLQIQQQQFQQQQQQQQQQQILRMGLTSTTSSLGYRRHPPQRNNNYYYDNSFLNSNGVSHCNFEGCNIVAILGRFCFAYSASSFAPHAHADSQRGGYVQGGVNQNAPTEIIIDAEEAGEKKQTLITSRKQKEGVAKQSETPLSSDTGEYCPDESEQDGRGHRCAVEDGQSHDSDKSLAAGVANLKDDNEQDTSDMRREGNQKDDEEQDASDDAPTQGGDDGGTDDKMEDHNSWGGDGRNEYNCEGVDNGDVHSEEGKQSHVVPEEIRATANDDEKEHEIKKKSDVIAELEEEVKANTTKMGTQLMTTVTSRLEDRVAKDAANATVEEMTKKFEAESGVVAELKKEVAARLELNASLRNQLEKPSNERIEVKEEELTDDEDFTARLTHKRTDQVLEELQTKNAMIQELLTENKQLKDVALAKNEELKTKNAKIQELTTENDQLKDDVRDKDQEITALKQQLIEMVQNRAEIETSEMI